MPDVLPNFFIVGAAKSGTTSLYNYLRRHPDVYMSPTKEPHWFSRVKPDPEQGAYAVTSEEEYLDLFKDRQHERAVGEASTSYLWDEKAPDRIKQSIPDAKIIILLREPVSRVFSHYLMDTRVGIQELPFYEAIQEDYENPDKGWYKSHLYVELGMYCEQVSRYFERFGRENVLVLFFEEFVADTDSALSSIARFLGIDADEVGGGQSGERRHNAHAVPRIGFLWSALDNEGVRKLGHRLLPSNLRGFLRDSVLLRQTEKPQIEPEALAFLGGLYASEEACLETLLERGLPWGRATD